MKDPFVIVVLLFLTTLSACSQEAEKAMRQVGGPCEGCEAALEYGDQILKSSDTLPFFSDNEPKLHVSGTVYENDGVTPAEGIILYVYHTDRNGIYPSTEESEGWARRHGDIRGWIQTDENGRYEFWTFRPAAYPSRSEPEHIHITIKEPGLIPYYIESFHFEDDPLLDNSERAAMNNRGGSGIVAVKHGDDILTVERDIVLGLNIPSY